MIVIYGSFGIDTEDRSLYDEWFTKLVQEARTEKGCIAYEYLIDPQQPTRGTIFEVWETQEDLMAHMVAPGHVEMMALGSMKWGMHDIRTTFWMEAGDGDSTIRDRTDTRLAGTLRGNVYDLIEEYQSAYSEAR